MRFNSISYFQIIYLRIIWQRKGQKQTKDDAQRMEAILVH
jgi:hypothetical protein